MSAARKKDEEDFLLSHAVQFHVHGTCCIPTGHLDQGLAGYKPVGAGNSLVGRGVFVRSKCSCRNGHHFSTYLNELHIGIHLVGIALRFSSAGSAAVHLSGHSLNFLCTFKTHSAFAGLFVIFVINRHCIGTGTGGHLVLDPVVSNTAK